jgi:Anti-sigma-K factor rskA
MSERPTKEEREALVAGDRAGALEADEAADLALLADLLADPSTWAEPDPGLEAAILRAVAAAEPDAPAAAPDVAAGSVAQPNAPAARVAQPDAPSAEGEPTTALPSIARLPQRDAGPRRRRLVLPVLAAAAAIAIVLGVVAATRSTTHNQFKSQLTATALAPAASGSAGIVRNDAGFRITLDTKGLAPLPDGKYYQAWLKNPAGTLVPIGSFSSSDGRVILWSGVSPVEYNTITVTIEATDNVQASSGQRVLVGEVHQN